MTRDDEEPVPTARGPWLGEVTGLRLGDVPEDDQGSTGKERSQNIIKHNYQNQRVSGAFYVKSCLLSWVLRGR